jgi:O-antigen/teichoic acid export membrane protein
MTDSSPVSGRPTATRAIIWTLLARQSERLIGIVSIAILARLLSPKDFGLVAMAGSAVALVEAFSAFGFDWAVVRLEQATPAHYDTAWTLRLLCGLLVAATLSIAAYPISLFFGQRAVMAIIFAMAFNSVLGAAENIWMAEFRRQMRFEAEFKLRFSGKLAGFVVATTWAAFTRSYWALVAGVTASRLASTLASYYLHRSRPQWDLSKRTDLLRFSAWLLFGNLTEVLRSRFADIWVGRVLGSRSVGFYSMASELSALATTELAAPINRVTFTMYSRQANDIPALRESYLRVSGLIWAVGLPAAVGVGVCAPWIVTILLGAQWGDAVPVLQILAAAGIIAIMAANTQYVYWALGRSRFVASLSFCSTLVFALFTLLLGHRLGLLGVATAQVVASAVVLLINFTTLFRTLSLSFVEVARRNYRVLLSAAVMGIVLTMIGHELTAIKPPLALQLATMIVSGASAYVIALALTWLLTGRPTGPEHDILGLLRKSRGTPALFTPA